MKFLLLIVLMLASIGHAQIIEIRVTDFKTNLPLSNADVYFMHSTKYFSTNNDGKVTIDLSGISPSDELFVAKKDYQNAKLRVKNIASDLNVKLEKMSEVKLNEALITNLTIPDILQKVIENYDSNYNVDKYYFLVDLRQDFKIDTLYHNLIHLNLQLKYNKGKVKVKTSGIVKNKLEEGKAPIHLSFDQSEYFKHLYILETLKSIYQKFVDKKYKFTDLKKSSYAEKKMYEIILENDMDDKTFFLIDRETFSVVEYALQLNNVILTNKNLPLERVGHISFKYRPYNDQWVLKESEVNFRMNLKQLDKEDLKIDFMHKISSWNFSEKPFQYFNKTLNLGQDLHDQF